jgi:actinorhodin biosynthesis protein ActVIA
MPATAAPYQAKPVTAELYALVQHFYARQMQALDANRFEEYAATFIEDGVFQHTPSAPPAVTRENIVAELIRFNQRYEGDPVRRRHWFNHLVLDEQEDGTLKATIYALVITTRPGAAPEIKPSCVVEDVLEVDGGQVLARSRAVSHDQLF